jgi:hypothetical protein
MPAAAAGPACTLACCAGRAPHAAGSCMHGSCQSGMSPHNPAGDKQNPHQHHQDQPTNENEAYDPSQPFAGAMASAGADSEMGEIPTIEAAPYEATFQSTETIPHKPGWSSMSAAALSKPCQTDCRLCASGFVTQKRSRHNSIPTRSNYARPTVSSNLTEVERFLRPAGSPQGSKCAPRGPPRISA